MHFLWIGMGILQILTLPCSLAHQHAFLPVDHMRERLDLQNVQEDTPPYPVAEEELEFPDPPHPQETDTNLLATYYKEVAQQYEAWGLASQEALQRVSRILHQARTKVHLAVVRRYPFVKASYHPTDVFHKNFYQTVNHQGRNYLHYQEIIDRAFKKSKYYKELASIYEEIYKEQTELPHP